MFTESKDAQMHYTIRLNVQIHNAHKISRAVLTEG